MPENEKPNCYKCEYRGGVAGSAHSSCNHPSTQKLKGRPLMGMAAIFGGGSPMRVEGLEVKGNPHGIRSGWFMWPLNYDPTWLESCDGFKGK